MFRLAVSKMMSSRSAVTAGISRVFLSSAATEPAFSIKDQLISLTFVDPSGARRKANGLIGKTLHQVCEMQGIDIGPSSLGAAPEVARTERWIEPTFGEGATSGFDHVVLVGSGSDTAARKTPAEDQMLNDYWEWDEIFAGSRLASSVVLTKEMDGMTVYVPDRIVDDIP